MHDKHGPSTGNGKASGKTSAKARGEVRITRERCKGCMYCIEFCPTGVLVISDKFNAKGYHYPEVADGTKCSGCDLCGMYCPDFAICGTRIRRD
jgi:2-oxoglutarate ferredoxin oxidoreductase subunit delta